MQEFDSDLLCHKNIIMCVISCVQVSSPNETNGPQNEAQKAPGPIPKPVKSTPPVNNGIPDTSEDEIAESPVPRRKKISVGMPIHPPEGEITNLQIVNRRVAEVKGSQIRTLMSLMIYITYVADHKC